MEDSAPQCIKMARVDYRPRILFSLPASVLFLAVELQVAYGSKQNDTSGWSEEWSEEFPNIGAAMMQKKHRHPRKAAAMMQTSRVFHGTEMYGDARHQNQKVEDMSQQNRKKVDPFDLLIQGSRIPDLFFGLEDAFDEDNIVDRAFALQAASTNTAFVEWMSLLSTVFIDVIIGAFGAATFMYLRKHFNNRPRPSAVPPTDSVGKQNVCSNAEASDAQGRSELHVAAAAGNWEAAKVLLQQQVDTNAREAWEETPLHLAARGGHVELCKLLLGHGAEIDAIGINGETPLIVAAKSGEEAVCQLLLLHGAGCAGLQEDELPELLVKMIAARIFPTED